MSDVFFLIVGIILTGIGLLLAVIKIWVCIRCSEPTIATVAKLEKEYTFFRGIEYTHYRPVVKYVVDGKTYTETAHFRTYLKSKYPVDSEMKICYDPNAPAMMRFVGHPFPLPLGLAFLAVGVVLIWCSFL